MFEGIATIPAHAKTVAFFQDTAVAIAILEMTEPVLLRYVGHGQGHDGYIRETEYLGQPEEVSPALHLDDDEGPAVRSAPHWRPVLTDLGITRAEIRRWR